MMPETTPPANVEAEQALLGIMLLDGSAYLGVSHLPANAFSEGFHRAIWDAVGDLVKENRATAPALVMEKVKGHPDCAEWGGLRYFADLIDCAPPAHTAPDYASVVQDCFIRRDLIDFAGLVRKRALDPDGASGSAVLADVRGCLDALEESTAIDDASMIAAPAAAAAAILRMQEIAESGKARGRMTGLRCIDRRLGGLRSGSLLVLGGRPGMGKTALARAIASGAADRNPDSQILFLGIEMGPEEMMHREISARTYLMDEGVEYRAMGSGAVTPMDLATCNAASRKIPPNLILDDCHSLGVDDVRRKVWSRKRHGHVGAVVIDYLQLMRRPRADGRNEASVLGEMTQGLKLLARQAETTIILLSQLSRQVEYREDKRPQLSDLRESGSIEQDADAVLFPFREYYYVSRNEPKSGTTEYLEWEMKCAELRTRLDVICAKQRQGPIGSDRQVYHAEFDHIEDEREVAR